MQRNSYFPWQTYFVFKHQSCFQKKESISYIGKFCQIQIILLYAEVKITSRPNTVIWTTTIDVFSLLIILCVMKPIISLTHSKSIAFYFTEKQKKKLKQKKLGVHTGYVNFLFILSFNRFSKFYWAFDDRWVH